MKSAVFVLGISIIGNIFLILIKIIFGILGNSKSLIADGVHSLSDLSTDVIAVFGSKMSQKEADESHPFGHGKIEYITSMIIAIIIIILGITIIINSFNKGYSIPNILVIIVSIITIIVKFFIARFVLQSGKKLNNQILLSSGKESFTDVFSSVMVLIIVILSQFSDVFPIFKYIDMLGSVVIGSIIMVVGLKLLFECASLIIGAVENNSEIILNIKKLINEYNKSIIVKDIILLKNGPYYKTDIHLLVNGKTTIKKADIIKNELKEILKEVTNLKYMIIEISSKE
ncbi:MAG: cation diffusion facilitator family transporter [Bacilli bacterium]